MCFRELGLGEQPAVGDVFVQSVGGFNDKGHAILYPGSYMRPIKAENGVVAKTPNNKPHGEIEKSIECNHCDGWVKQYWKYCPKCGGQLHHA